MKRTLVITSIIIVCTFIALALFNKFTSKKDNDNMFGEAVRGDFEIAITAAGELLAEYSTDIKAPEIARGRDIHASDLKITDIIAEGTEVSKGDYIATLDRTQFDNTLKDETERLTTFRTNLQTKCLTRQLLLPG